VFKGFREEHQLQYQSTTQLQTKQEEEEECHALFGSQKVSATSIRGGGNAKNLAFSSGSSNQKPRHLINTTEIAHIFYARLHRQKRDGHQVSTLDSGRKAPLSQGCPHMDAKKVSK
jgi:hypothetical protein